MPVNMNTVKSYPHMFRQCECSNINHVRTNTCVCGKDASEGTLMKDVYDDNNNVRSVAKPRKVPQFKLCPECAGPVLYESSVCTHKDCNYDFTQKKNKSRDSEGDTPPGKKRCPDCNGFVAIRRAECNCVTANGVCGHVFYAKKITADENRGESEGGTPSEKTPLGKKRCPKCGLFVAARSSTCSIKGTEEGCGHVFYAVTTVPPKLTKKMGDVFGTNAPTKICPECGTENAARRATCINADCPVDFRELLKEKRAEKEAAQAKKAAKREEKKHEPAFVLPKRKLKYIPPAGFHVGNPNFKVMTVTEFRKDLWEVWPLNLGEGGSLPSDDAVLDWCYNVRQYYLDDNMRVTNNTLRFEAVNHLGLMHRPDLTQSLRKVINEVPEGKVIDITNEAKTTVAS